MCWPREAAASAFKVNIRHEIVFSVEIRVALRFVFCKSSSDGLDGKNSNFKHRGIDPLMEEDL
jgi:hypothetical protein